MAWASLRGMPQARADFAAGQICSVVANVNRSKEGRVFEPGDFIPLSIVQETEQEEVREEIVLIDVEANSKALEQMLSRKE